MNQPEKPFCCHEYGCGESFTNADRLAVHAKKHDLVLQLGSKGGTFVADQTPTPTRFIKNCEDVGLFQDLQNVNIFEDSFKREMESRSMNSLSLDNHLTTTSTASDDTLHTPHIFPHITSDSGLNIYDNDVKSEGQLNITERNSVNSDIIDQTLTKCLNTSTEENITSLSNDRNYVAKIVNIKKNKRGQFVRQNSVDIVDSESSSVIMKDVTNNEVVVDKVSPLKQGLKSRRINQCNNLKDMRMPVILTPDSSENDTLVNGQSIENKGNNISNYDNLLDKAEDTSKNSNLLTVPEIDKNNLKNSVNNNFNKLISQKSIDMALANFTREANQKPHDIHNISIEDIPSMEELNNENCAKDLSVSIHKNMDNLSANSSIIENENSVSIPNLLSPNIVYGNKRKNSYDISNTDLSKHTVLSEKGTMDKVDPQTNNSVANHIRKSVIFQKNCNQIQNEDNVNTDGYELLLKLPDGKKVYLKEVCRDDEDDPNDTSNIKSAPKTIPNTVSVLRNDNIASSSVKRKLHDIIQANKKNTPNMKLPISKTQSNSEVLRECIFIPQVLPITKLDSPHIITNSVPLLPVGLVSPSETLICNSINIVNNTKFEKTVIQKKHSSNNKKPTELSEADKKKINKDIQIRNRAAVNRYRTRKKRETLMLEEKNRYLENKNEDLSTRLALAMQEIKRLSELLALHNVCSNSLQPQDSVGVIKTNDLRSVENLRNNKTMVIVQNKKLTDADVVEIDD